MLYVWIPSSRSVILPTVRVNLRSVYLHSGNEQVVFFDFYNDSGTFSKSKVMCATFYTVYFSNTGTVSEILHAILIGCITNSMSSSLPDDQKCSLEVLMVQRILFTVFVPRLVGRTLVSWSTCYCIFPSCPDYLQST